MRIKYKVNNKDRIACLHALFFSSELSFFLPKYILAFFPLMVSILIIWLVKTSTFSFIHLFYIFFTFPFLFIVCLSLHFVTTRTYLTKYGSHKPNALTRSIDWPYEMEMEIDEKELLLFVNPGFLFQKMPTSELPGEKKVSKIEKIPYSEIIHLKRIKNHILMHFGAKYPVIVVPRRAFTERKSFDEFFKLIKHKMNEDPSPFPGFKKK